MIFSLFYCYSSFGRATFSICKMHTGSWKHTPNIIINSEHHPPLILGLFPILLLFSFSIATLSIFGNVHYILKSLPTVITNSEHPPLFLTVKSPLFYHYFSFTKALISIFGSAQWPLKTVPNGVTSSEPHCWAHLRPNTTTDQKNISFPHLFHKIHSKAIPAQKYISKLW